MGDDKQQGEEYLRVSYTGEVQAAKAALAETPHRCPVCGGRGFVSAGFYQGTSGIATIGGIAPDECRTCEGRGIIWRD